MLRRLKVLTLLGAALVVIGACSLVNPSDGVEGRLVYTGPTEQSIRMGDTLPGANIRYVGYGEQGAEVLINDQRAIKKIGDSLDWQGSPVPGTDIDIAQRVLFANESRLQTVGTVKVTVQDARPEVALFPGETPYTYKVAVTHAVEKGDMVPGTLISYVGKTDEGAQFGGVNGYPYRKIGDSVLWQGRLRPGAYLDSTYRVMAYTDDFVTLAALATVALTP